MNMRMILHLPAPGVQHSEKARQITADALRIRSQRSDRLGRGCKLRIISHTLMGTHERTYFFGNGKSNHKIIAGQQFFQLRFHPIQGFAALARGTVSVATAAINMMPFAALFTFIHGKTMNWGAATDNGINHLAMHAGHVGAESFQIGRPVGGKNILYGAHFKTLS